MRINTGFSAEPRSNERCASHSSFVTARQSLSRGIGEGLSPVKLKVGWCLPTEALIPGRIRAALVEPPMPRVRTKSPVHQSLTPTPSEQPLPVEANSPAVAMIQALIPLGLQAAYFG